MNRFIDEIKDKNFTQGEKLEPEALIIAQKVLHNMKLGLIPQSYADFLKKFNVAPGQSVKAHESLAIIG